MCFLDVFCVELSWIYLVGACCKHQCVFLYYMVSCLTFQAMRGRAPAPMRGGGGMARGGPGAARGSRGTMRGRGAPASGRGRGGNVAQKMQRGGKRKAGGDVNTVMSKRRNLDNWGAQPIAQQPLDQSGYSGGGGNYNNEQWYQDSYGQNWG